MTIVNIALRVPSASGVDVPAVGTLDFKPVARRTVGDTIVLPRPFRVSLVSGNATVSLAATGADWFWQVTENTQQRYQRSVAVPLLPNPVGYEDLVDVDPKTFAPDTSLVPGWVAAVPIAVDEWLTENPPPAGPPNTLTIGTVTEGATPAASITGASPNQTLDLTLKTGAPGAPGPPNSLAIGTVSSGGTAAASITGTPPNQVLDLTLKTGDAGPPNSLTIGTVVEGPTAGATITGASPSQTLNLVLPEADPGPPNTLTIGTVQDGAVPAATITGTAPNQVLDLTLKTGDPGPPNSLTIGTVQDGPTPAASITGTAPNQTLNLTLKTGDAGPPNTLTAGAVTQIPAGGQPTFSVTGTAPNQTLNLGLVDGSPTAFELRGEGFPGTGTNATATNAAATGTYYTDVLGTNGAWRWLKTSAGTGNARWKVIHGDTKDRKIWTPDLKSGWQQYHSLIPITIRRINQTIFISGWVKRTTDASYSARLFDLPAGFRPVDSSGMIPLGQVGAGTHASNGWVVDNTAGVRGLNIRWNPETGASALAPDSTWRIPLTALATSDPWPTTLPFAP